MNDIFSSKSRFLVNILGAPLLLLIILKGGLVFSGLIFLAMILATKELYNLLLKVNIAIYKYLFYLIYLFLLVNFLQISQLAIFIDSLTINKSLIIFLILLVSYQFLFIKKNYWMNLMINFFAIFWVGISLFLMIEIRYLVPSLSSYFFEFNIGFYLTLIMFLSVWLCDSAAYIVGSKFGKIKLFPSISPKKTWIGAVSGFTSVFIFIFILYNYNYFNFEGIKYTFSIIDMLLITLIFGFISQLGDLFESLIKRKVNVKDSGTILMGHGGVLDRMDSLMFVSPAFYIYIKFYIGL